jgi:hypothetical protein
MTRLALVEIWSRAKDVDLEIDKATMNPKNPRQAEGHQAILPLA